MTSSHKYNRSEGCCICATKNSTSQFRPWYDHYSEETYCRVFNLDTLAGRRGYVCNPCVLYIKRAIQSLDNPSVEQRERPPDHTKRLDSKLKGSARPVISDIYPPGTTHHVSSWEPSSITRAKKCQPRYVYIGKPYLKLTSTFQLMHAGPWRDPKTFLEDEDDAEKDLKFYRRVTLRKGEKTLKQKAEDKKMKDVLEDEMLFGKLPMSKKKQKSKIFRRDQSSDLLDIEREAADRNKSMQTICTNYGTRASASIKKRHGENESSGEDTDSSDEAINECDGNPDEMEDGSLSSHSPGSFSCSDWTGMGTRSVSSRCGQTACLVKKKNRRVRQQPVKNLKPRKVSFMDCSYWQKFPMCCFDIYMGEGKLCVMRPSNNFLFKCIRWHEQLAKRKQLKNGGTSVASENTAVEAADNELDRESEAMSHLSSGDDLIEDMAIGPEMEQEMEMDRDSEVLSQTSSGDDLNEDRTNFTSSPVVEDSLPLEEFHCRAEQGSHWQQKAHGSCLWKSVL